MSFSTRIWSMVPVVSELRFAPPRWCHRNCTAQPIIWSCGDNNIVGGLMSEKMNLDQLEIEARRLVKLLEDRQPGLFTWCMMLDRTIKSIIDETGYNDYRGAGFEEPPTKNTTYGTPN